MAKIIKRVGIVFFVLVISFLLILGCVFAVNTVKQDSDLGNNTDNNIQPVASKSYSLSGSCEAMFNTWQEAANYSKSNNGALVSLTLKNNWEAITDVYGSYFGYNRVIIIPTGANMSLNLNGYNVDRKLSNAVDNTGYVFRVSGTFTLDDYNISGPAYDKNYKDIPHYGLCCIEGFGQIRGGAQYCDYSGEDYGAAAIYVEGTFNMMGGVIGANQLKFNSISDNSKYGVVYCGPSAVFNFENGAIVENSASVSSSTGRIAAVSWEDGAEIHLKKGVIVDNNKMAGACGYGGYLYIGGGDLWIYSNMNDNVSSGILLMDKCTRIDGFYCRGAIGSGSHIEIYDKRSNISAAFTSGFKTANPNATRVSEGHISMASEWMKEHDERLFLDSNGEVKLGILTKIAKPTQGATSNYRKTYTGSTLTYYPVGYDSNTMTISDNTGINAGMYSADVFLKNGYVWSDNSVNSLTFNWYIDPKPITKPTVKTSSSFEYNGQVKTLQFNNYSSTTMTISGNTATNAGSYNAVVSLKDKNNYKWSDNKIDNLTFTWTITPKPISKPAAADTNEYIFNNAEQTYMPKGYNSSTMVITDNKNTNVGEYTAKVTPNSNHKWSDGTTTAVEFKYKIIPPGVVVKDGVKYDYQYIDSNNIRQSYGNSYMHKLNDENLNIVNGVSKYVLGNIPVNTSIEVFLNNLQSDRNLIKIYAKESDISPIYDGLTGTRNNLSQTLATGFKVELYESSEDATLLDTVYLSVLGDINGDGMINASDVSYLRQVANDSTLLESMSLERQLACMINNKGGITEVDSEILRNYIGKEIDIDKFMESETVSTSNAYTYLTLDRDNMLRKTSTSKTNVIGNISVNTNVEAFKTKLAEMGINISAMTIYNRKGDEVTDNTAIVGTGWSIEVGGEKTYLSVLGDLTGDGRITAADISYLRAIAASDTTNVKDCILLSAILLNKGGITTADSEVLKQAIKGSILLSEYNN